MGKTIAIDGKTISSTANMKNFERALNVASAFVVENGITIGELVADSKSNEIPIVRELIRLFDVTGSTIVADALHCQEETAKEILKVGANYVLSVKKNQQNLYEDIAGEFEFKRTDKCEIKTSPLESKTAIEKGHGRIDTRRAFVTHDAVWLKECCKFDEIKTIGEIATKSETLWI